MKYPTEHEITQLHRRCAPHEEAFELVYIHCMVVRDIARQLLARYEGEIDRELVEAGCMLHDIGVYRLYDERGEITYDETYIRHGVLGEELLRKIGWDERLLRIASHHTGVGITRSEIIAHTLPLPTEDFVAETAEERLVMYADKFHSKANPNGFLTAHRFRRKIVKHGEHKVNLFNALVAEFGEPVLEPLSERYGFEIAR